MLVADGCFDINVSPDKREVFLKDEAQVIKDLSVKLAASLGAVDSVSRGGASRAMVGVHFVFEMLHISCFKRWTLLEFVFYCTCHVFQGRDCGLWSPDLIAVLIHQGSLNRLSLISEHVKAASLTAVSRIASAVADQAGIHSFEHIPAMTDANAFRKFTLQLARTNPDWILDIPVPMRAGKHNASVKQKMLSMIDPLRLFQALPKDITHGDVSCEDQRSFWQRSDTLEIHDITNSVLARSS